MSFVQPTDFIGEVNIPNNGDAYNGVKSTVQYFIDKYEPIFLKSLLGSELYALYVTGITPVPVDPPTDPATYLPIDPKWINIQTITKPYVINFIYYWFKRDEATYSSGTGVAMAKGENSTAVSPARKMVDRWNEMVEGVYGIVKNWDAATYGDYYINFSQYNCWGWGFCEIANFFRLTFSKRLPDIFFTINLFGI